MRPIKATHEWPTNSHLIQDVATLGYLRKDWLTLDVTYGLGGWWKCWRPDRLVGMDRDPQKAHSVQGDFTDLPFPDRAFDAVVFDPPYMLNGAPTQGYTRYGITEKVRWQDKIEFIKLGIWECSRVLGDGYLLVKCQAQVVSGHVRWQDFIFTQYAREYCDMGLVDRFDMLSYRAQPDGTSQVHARRNTSTLLVFKRGHKS